MSIEESHHRTLGGCMVFLWQSPIQISTQIKPCSTHLVELIKEYSNFGTIEYVKESTSPTHFVFKIYVDGTYDTWTHAWSTYNHLLRSSTHQKVKTRPKYIHVTLRLIVTPHPPLLPLSSTLVDSTLFGVRREKWSDGDQVHKEHILKRSDQGTKSRTWEGAEKSMFPRATQAWCRCWG